MGIKRFTDKSKAKTFRNQKKKQGYKYTKLQTKGKSTISIKRGRHWVKWGKSKSQE